jgi:hypothetical protein
MTSMKAFIKANRPEIDEYIHQFVPDVRLDDVERRSWIHNDEGLYRWARSEGVPI